MKPVLSLRRFPCLVAAAVTAAGVWAMPAAPASAAEIPRVGDNQAADGERFLRFRDLRNGGFLETSIVTYANDAGQRVDLIGAVHVGDETYYDLLDEIFTRYDVLLYEMVKPRDAVMGQAPAAREGEVPLAMRLIGGLQKGLQLALELEYQTAAIDYTAPNFVHADLDLETFLRLQSERGEGFLEMFLKQAIRDITRPGEGRAAQPQISFMEVMDAMNAPDRARRLKLLFARELSRMEDMMAVFDPSGEGSVILDVRNDKAVEVLERELARNGVSNVGIFYGAAHMPGIATLLEERGFTQQGEPEYLVAWDMTLDNRGRREMRQRMRQAIVEHHAGAAGDAGDVGPAAAALRAEVEGLRRENEALRRQVTALRQQLEQAE